MVLISLPLSYMVYNHNDLVQILITTAMVHISLPLSYMYNHYDLVQILITTAMVHKPLPLSYMYNHYDSSTDTNNNGHGSQITPSELYVQSQWY